MKNNLETVKDLTELQLLQLFQESFPSISLCLEFVLEYDSFPFPESIPRNSFRNLKFYIHLW